MPHRDSAATLHPLRERAGPRPPAQLTSFVGRRDELTAIRAHLSRARLVTLTGVGGVGKTRLALAAADRVARAFPDGVWLVDLAPLTDGGMVADRAARALGVRDDRSVDPWDRLLDHVADRRLLLVLDNCEHLPEDAARLADTLLRRAPGLRVLATSRRTLGITGELVHTVPPLSVPAPGGAAHTDVLARNDSVALLLDRARAVRPDFALTETDGEAAIRLVTALDGLPLAIELAAARLRTLTLHQVAARVADRFELLTSGSSTAQPRQRTLRALIDWTRDLCLPEERLCWSRLSVFRDGFDLAAAEAVCADDSDPLPASARSEGSAAACGGPEPADSGRAPDPGAAGIARARVLDLLDRLVDHSVLWADTHGPTVRYRMLETVRSYGAQHLDDDRARGRVEHRHRAHYLCLAEDSARHWCGPDQRERLAVLRREHGNLGAAFRSYLADSGQGRQALRLATALRYHWCGGGHLAEGRQWLDLALAAAPEPSRERVVALSVAGWIAMLQGRRGDCTAHLDACDELADRVGDPRGHAYTALWRGSCALFDGDIARAIALFEDSARAHERLGGTVTGLLFALFQKAAAHCHAGDPDAGREAAERALDLGARVGENWARSHALWALGLIAWTQGDPARARRLALEGLAAKRGIHDLVGAVLLIELLAWIACSHSDAARAARLLGDARALWRATGSDIPAFGPDLDGHHDRCRERTERVLGAAATRTAIARGERRTVAEAMADALDETPGTDGPGTGPALAALTRREREVADLVAQGLTNRGIAEELVLSPRTVDGHVERILAKLAFTSRAQIAAWSVGHR